MRNRTCQIPDCEDLAEGGGLCETHFLEREELERLDSEPEIEWGDTLKDDREFDALEIGEPRTWQEENRDSRS